jgi:cytochrome c oxidase subunit IV
MTENIEKKSEASTHKIGIYLWIWLLLFILSGFPTVLIILNSKDLLDGH